MVTILATPQAPEITMQSWKQVIGKLKSEIYVLYLASIDPRIPWYARFLAVVVTAYVFSPIDLIPDFIPVIGYLDDLILVPLGIWCVLKMIPPKILRECREKAAKIPQKKFTNWGMAGVIITLWVVFGVLTLFWLLKLFKS